MNAVRVARSPEPGTDKYVPVWSYGANHTITQTRPTQNLGRGRTYVRQFSLVFTQEPSMVSIEFIKARSIITSTGRYCMQCKACVRLFFFEKNKQIEGAGNQLPAACPGVCIAFAGN